MNINKALDKASGILEAIITELDKDKPKQNAKSTIKDCFINVEFLPRKKVQEITQDKFLDELGKTDNESEKELSDSMLNEIFVDDKLEKAFNEILADAMKYKSKGKSKKCEIPEMKTRITVDEALIDAIGKVEDEVSFSTLCQKERPKIDRLIELGILGSDDVRSHNVGASDYSKHTIQPWAIWKDYDLDPFDADIIKRVLRDKKGESKKLDYEKIIHICQEKLRQIG